MTEFTFVALYKNKDRITLDDDVSFDNISRENLEGMQVMLPNGAALFTLHLEDDQKLIFRRRKALKSGLAPEQISEPQIYLVGWRKKIGGELVQSITYIVDYPGRGFSIHQAGKFDEKHPWFYSPSLHEQEVFEGERYQKDGIWKTR